MTTIIGTSVSGKVVSIRRRGSNIDIYVDGILFAREGSPPHWTLRRERTMQMCEVCGGMFVSHCSRCRKNAQRREARRRAA